jgi:hypothetical protein
MGFSMTRRQCVIDLLSKVLDGRMSSADALEAWPNIDDPTDDRLMKNAWHSLYHFDTDEDIRSKEPAYETRQRAALQGILDELRKPPEA